MSPEELAKFKSSVEDAIHDLVQLQGMGLCNSLGEIADMADRPAELTLTVEPGGESAKIGLKFLPAEPKGTIQ